MASCRASGVSTSIDLDAERTDRRVVDVARVAGDDRLRPCRKPARFGMRTVEIRIAAGDARGGRVRHRGRASRTDHAPSRRRSARRGACRPPPSTRPAARTRWFAVLFAARTSGSSIDPPITVIVPRQLISGRTPIAFVDIPGRRRAVGRRLRGAGVRRAEQPTGTEHSRQSNQVAATEHVISPR